MTDRERLVAYMAGEPVDRPPYWIFWMGWARTMERWRREGMPADAEPVATFGADQKPRVVPVNYGPCPSIERVVLSEDDDYIVSSDSWGIKRRDYKHGESMSEFLEFPVKSRRDWEQFKEERLDPHHPDRLAGDWRGQCAEWTRQGIPIQLGDYPSVTVFGGLRWLLGPEECLVAFHTDPDLVRDIMDHLTTVFLAVFTAVAAEVRVDAIHIWEDMCGRQGPLISPRHWREFMGPNYRRIRDFAGAHDIPLISVDTDGDPDLIIPSMMEAGVNFLFPFEVAAGCDVNLVREKYPTLGMMGGFDKRALAAGPAAIDRELARITPAVAQGRYIPGTDHLVPDDVSWEDFCYYAGKLKQLVGAA